MSRKGIFKMQTVVRSFEATPFDWASSKEACLRNAKWTFILLSCGHAKRDPWESYQNETAVRVRSTLARVFGPQGVRRARCAQCVSGKPQAGVPKIIPEAEPK